jgi:chromosomal replication initiator protein
MADAVIEIPIPGQKNHAPSEDREQTAPVLPRRSFLAGPENRLAAVVVRSMLQRSANGCNPVTLYGPSGSGKSHLALGLAAAWKEKHRRERVECTTAADFARELAEAVAAQGLDEFREKYRQAALVVIEDLHQLAERRSAKLDAQEELIHTLNALTKQGSWALLTSTIAPGECSGILPLLQSRLMGGLIVPLALPGYTARLALIRQQSAALQCELSKPAIEALAQGVQGSVPEIQRMMARFASAPPQRAKPVGLKAVKQFLNRRALNDIPSLREIAVVTAKHFGLNAALLRGPSRKRNHVLARDLAIYLSRQLFHFSLEEIGRSFGGRDHTTVMHSCRKIETLAKTDAPCRRELELLKKQVNRLDTAPAR